MAATDASSPLDFGGPRKSYLCAWQASQHRIPARGASHSTHSPPMMTNSFGRVHTFPVASKRRTAPLRAGYISLARIDGRGTVPRPPRSIPARGASHSTHSPPMMTKSFGRVHTFPVGQAAHRAAPSGLHSTRAHRRKGDWLLWPRREPRPVLFNPRDAPCGQSSLSPVGRVHTLPVSGKRRTAPLRAGYIPLARIVGRGTGNSGPGAGSVQSCSPLLTRRVARAACPQSVGSTPFRLPASGAPRRS